VDKGEGRGVSRRGKDSQRAPAALVFFYTEIKGGFSQRRTELAECEGHGEKKSCS